MKSAILVIPFFISTLAFAETYKLDHSHTEIGFSAKHLMISNVKGKFEKFDGSFDYDSKKNQLKDVSIEIVADSINTANADRDKHLREADFLETAKHNKITFKTEKVHSIKGKSAKVDGILTIKGIPKKVTLDVTNNGEAEFMGTKKIGFSAKTQINRKDFGMNFDKKIDKGGLVVSDDVQINIEGEGNLIPDTAAVLPTAAPTK